jgi:rubrerythrin
MTNRRMKMTKTMLVRWTLSFGLVLACAGLLAPAAQAAGPGKTLDNLQAAFDGESNAHARYLAFAKKADEEGYGPVASLFRAAAKAEEIHAATHAAVIKGLGAEPKAAVKSPEVKSTKENLEAAFKGESYERDTMYPEFIKQAKADRNKKAVVAFTEAKVAEASHAKLYEEASKNLAAWKGAKRELDVCSVCGYIVATIDFKKCPNCMEPISKYVKVG